MEFFSQETYDFQTLENGGLIIAGYEDINFLLFTSSPGAKYFLFEDLLHPFVRKLFCIFTSAMRKSMLHGPVPGSF